jgi:selenocysteine-specific elongation factor
VSIDLLEYYVRHGRVVRVGKDRYYGCDALDRLLLTILRAVQDTGGATPAQLKEQTGLTRKYLIPVLEWMDGRGMTRREAEVRRLGPTAVEVLNAVDSG